MDPSQSTSSQTTLPSEPPRSAKLAELGYSGPAAVEEGRAADSTNPTDQSPGAKPASTQNEGFFRRLLNSLRSTVPNKRLGGICNDTFFRLLFTVFAIGVVAMAWTLSIIAVQKLAKPSESVAEEDPSNPVSPTVYIHVVFVITTLALLLTLKHNVVQARDERQAYAHPQEVLPRYNTYEEGDAYAPLQTQMRPLWLAGTLRDGRRGSASDADAGVPGTVGPPPPAYGRTRGSTLLLRGMPSLREIEGQDSSSSRRSSRASSIRTPPGSPPRRHSDTPHEVMPAVREIR
ncbi:hypothetical protein FRB94_011973 [Tulasnella sp. JGI-2019a]|nr:hypothetical protein FRB94_011973 [Tulasnella sp. JGI-2019a]KAG9034531.1 hypothetical protein FRB95_013098 [Tulasnella sp. JGI-2019a]